VSAAAAPIVHQNFDITLNEIGPDCDGLPVLVKETLHFVLLVNADNAGGFHVDSVVNIKNGTGTNLVTGASYVATGANATSFQAKPPFPAVISNEASAVVVSKGPLPNIHTKILIHDTVNANGIVTASIFRFEVTCSG
jgi:hypothetical protein